MTDFNQQDAQAAAIATMPGAVATLFSTYPAQALPHLLTIRQYVFDISEQRKLGAVTESLKWQQPSYQVAKGSPVRIGVSRAPADSVLIFCHCQTKLVDTFRQRFSDCLIFHGNRAIELSLKQPLPKAPLMACLTLALTYHQVKHLPLLGW